MATVVPVTLIPATFIKINSFLHNDAARTRIVSGVRLTGSDALGEVYKVVGGVKTLIATTNALGKEDSLSCVVLPDGTLIIDVSEADTGGSGTTCAGRVYTFTALLPPSAITTDNVVRTALKAFATSVTAALTALGKALG